MIQIRFFFLNLPSPPQKKQIEATSTKVTQKFKVKYKKTDLNNNPPQPTNFASQADHNRPTRRSLEIPRFLELSGHVRKIQPLVAEIPEVPGSTTSFKGQAQQRQGS